MGSIPQLYPDRYYRLDYNPINNKVRFNRNFVGPCGWITIPLKDYVDSNNNSIYYDTAAGNDSTGTGIKTNPYQTKLKSANSCSATITKTLQLNTADTWEDLSTLDNAYFEGFFADTGVTARYSLRWLDFEPSDSNAIFVAKTGSPGADGTQADPFDTITEAIIACDGTHQAIVIMDSEIYTEPGIEFTGNFQKLVAAIGQTPSFVVQANSTLIDPITERKSITIFNSTSTTQISNAKMSNGNVVTVYVDSDNQGKFIIHDKDGTIIVTETTFYADVTRSPSVAVFSDNSFVISFTGWYVIAHRGRFVKYNSSGVQLIAPTVFEGVIRSGADEYRIPVVVLSDDTFIITYTAEWDADKGKFVKYNSSGVQLIAPTVFDDTVPVISIDCKRLSTDNFIISYTNTSDYYAKFIIYDKNGNIVKSKTDITNGNDHTKIGIFSNDNFVIIYNNDSGSGSFSIYDSTGTLIKSSTIFEPGTIAYLSTGITTEDLFIISYADTGDSNKGKFVVYNALGTQIITPTEFESGVTRWTALTVNIDDSIFIAYSDNGNSDYGKFLIYNPIRWDGIKISIDAIINGIDISSEFENIYRLIYGNSAGATLKYCNLHDVNNLARPAGTFLFYSLSATDIQNCIISDNYQSIYAENNSVIIKNNACYRNIFGYAIHVKGAGVGIDIQHNTIFENSGGIKLESNDGDEIVKNNILHDNSTYDIYADTSLEITYSIQIGNVHNITLGAGVLHINPLFVNEGVFIPADIDLNLKNTIYGDFSTSPAYQLADDTAPDRDAGCYDVIPVGPTTTWSSITIRKPKEGWIINYEPIGAVLTKKASADIETSMDALLETITIKHDGVTVASLEAILELLTCGNSLIRFIPNSVTAPNTYFLYKWIYEQIQISDEVIDNMATGFKNIQLKFGRAWE